MGVYEDMANDAGYPFGTDENRQMAESIEASERAAWEDHAAEEARLEKLQELEQHREAVRQLEEELGEQTTDKRFHRKDVELEAENKILRESAVILGNRCDRISNEVKDLRAERDRLRVECEAWRSGRLFTGYERVDDGSTTKVWIVYGAVSDTVRDGVVAKRYITIDAAVDALMEEVTP